MSVPVELWKAFVRGARSIRTTLVVSHMVLCLLLIAAFGFRQYQSEADLMIKASGEIATAASAPIINHLLPAIAGGNYQLAQLPQAERTYDQAARLIYFRAVGVGEKNKSPFALSYARSVGTSWREHFPAEYVGELNKRLQKINTAAQTTDANADKIAFVRARVEEQLSDYHNSKQLVARFSQIFELPDIGLNEQYLNYEEGLLHLRLPIHGLAAGEIWLIQDASELAARLESLLQRVAFEICTAMLLSTVLIIAGTQLLVRPLRQLTDTMALSVDKIDADGIPCVSRQDEIGLLARCFATLVARMQGQIDELRRLSVTDPLTSLPTRRHFDTAAPQLLRQAAKNGGVVALGVIDADRFKLYNDNYGHEAGDNALLAVAECLRHCFCRQSDVIARFGGEEFVVMSSGRSFEAVSEPFDKFLRTLRACKIEHRDNPPTKLLSASLGIDIQLISKGSIPPHLRDMFHNADIALYQAKEQGRDRIAVFDHKSDLGRSKPFESSPLDYV